jgi:hypothetical protein
MKPTPGSRSPKRDEPFLPLETFRKTVLDFQLSSHTEYLHDVQISFAHNDGKLVLYLITKRK